MTMQEILPIGSVVLLKKALKKIVVIGLFPTQTTHTVEEVTYDYMGLPYPEGYMGENTVLFFDKDQIQEIVFRGYDDDERKFMLGAMKKILDSAERVVEEKVNE